VPAQQAAPQLAACQQRPCAGGRQQWTAAGSTAAGRK
jgi:hypothetical protein